MQLLCRPENSYASLLERYPEALQDCGPEVNMQIELSAKYAGYIERQHGEVAKLAHLENAEPLQTLTMRRCMACASRPGQKLSKAAPDNLGQASRLWGVSPADISVLLIALKNIN